MLQRATAQNQLVDVYEKLKDWPSLIPTCLVVAPNRDLFVSCYNCKAKAVYSRHIYVAANNWTIRSPSPNFLCNQSSSLQGFDAPRY
jgi:hypothetical protein